MPQTKNSSSLKPLLKCITGVRGLDEITFGGLPQGRPTLVCGGAGCGKTLLAMEFLVRGATELNEPGVYMAFEETAEELSENVASLGFDLNRLVADKKLVIDHVRVERSEIEETGEYDLEGLFVRLDQAINSIGAKRVALDTVESLFSAFSNENILRAELRRMFHWLKSRGVTAIITGERGERSLTRFGLEEYVSDCVISLDHRVDSQISTRRLRIVKYRGSQHGTNEYPFLIDDKGICVMPITSIGLTSIAPTERISSGIPRLDAMLGGKGFYRGTTILVAGTAGTGKSSLAASFVNSSCRRGEKCLYFAFEESPSQIVRNMRSIGIDLASSLKKGNLRIEALRATSCGLETHLASMQKAVSEFDPSVVILDPVTDLAAIGEDRDIKSTLTRMVDFLKNRQITTLMTNLTRSGLGPEDTEFRISSIIDTWILLRDIESGGERNRGIYILKSRGMAHSNQIREFVLSDKGIDIVDVYLGEGGVLTGSARLIKESQDAETERLRLENIERAERVLERERKIIDAKIVALQAEYASKEEDLKQGVTEEKLRLKTMASGKQRLMKSRRADQSRSASVWET